ncbi:hypothetical protein C0Q70_17691 [Pomacea canaliculata]|uniref:LTD domain-containing protein n=1 Tax=Pomacea canaliculata TaxID=400727 RepID=A0A2T7NL45_POMCA|nr:hypothetical protein C0Q70_17691 [Pomacea canaliculata]
MNEMSSLHSPLNISTQSQISSGFESARSTGFESFTMEPTVQWVSMEMEGERLRREMQENNAVLQDYAENISFLKVQTRLMRDKSEDQAQENLKLKEEYEDKLSSARDLVEKVKDERAHLEVEVENLERKMEQAQKELEEAKRWRDEDVKKISELEEKVSILTVRLENNPMIVERQRDKETIAKLEDDVRSIAQDFLTEMNSRLEAENRVHTLTEELKFLRAEHEKCQKRLAILESRETNVIYSDFWKKELSQLRAYIQAEFQAEQETRERNHKFQIFSLREKIEHLSHLQNENDDLQNQVEKLMKLVRQMLTIQSEVTTYGKTLTGLSNIRPDLTKQSTLAGTPLCVSTTTRNARATFQTTGDDVTIADVDPLGKHITIKNNSPRDVKLANWTLKREVEGSEPLVYNFPPSAVVMAGKTLKVWSSGHVTSRGANDLVFYGAKSWGTGYQTTTTLYSNSEEQAS